MNIKLESNQHRGSTSRKQICAVHECTHIPNVWKIAHVLNEVGAHYESKFKGKQFVKGDWICNREFSHLKRYVESITMPKIKDETVDTQIQPFPMDKLPDYSLMDSRTLVNFITASTCSNCSKHNTLLLTNFTTSGADLMYEFTCVECNVRMDLPSLSSI